MGKLKQTVKVIEIHGEIGRYYVESWERPGLPHTVDLFMEGGHGCCDCRDYCTTVARNRKAHPGEWHDYGTPRDINPDRTQCRHICIAQKKHKMTTFPAIAAKVYPPDPNPHGHTQT